MLKPETLASPARYLLVGIGCAVLNNVILIGADAGGAHYTIAIVLTLIITMPLAYLLHALWTFQSRLTLAGFARYLAGSMSSVIVAALLVALLRGGLAWPMVVAAPAATVGMTIYNYIMTRWAVGPRTPQDLRESMGIPSE
ncbi:GtrA family protein [Altererythrobacter sp. GH1-8]|uniref:GtrA family protein n=1 Tax=Altererythrobacter sp. GH1-8 TaxID=3349333 RepID=UPI00374CF3CA